MLFKCIKQIKVKPGRLTHLLDSHFPDLPEWGSRKPHWKAQLLIWWENQSLKETSAVPRAARPSLPAGVRPAGLGCCSAWLQAALSDGQFDSVQCSQQGLRTDS